MLKARDQSEPGKAISATEFPSSGEAHFLLWSFHKWMQDHNPFMLREHREMFANEQENKPSA